MTTTHHAPHTFGDPLTAAELNGPLGELDAAIETVIATGSGVSTSLTAQASAGQATLLVASSAGFAPGDSIYIGAGAAFESRIIATVPGGGVSLTVTVNLSNTYAAGKPVSKSPVEIVDARGGLTTLGARFVQDEGRVAQIAINVKVYGALGNGVADDTAAIEAASVALAAAGGGVLYAPPGTYMVSWFENPDFAGYFAGVILRDGCTLRGAGIGATTIKLIAAQASHASAQIVTNHTLEPAGASWAAGEGDENLTVADLTVDGNGANQSTLYNGIGFYFVRGARHERVRALNVRGTANFPPGETFGMVCSQSTDISYVDCEGIGTAGTHGTGFGSNLCTNVIRVNCIAHGMSFGFGFADWTSRGVHNVNCVAQQNGASGFNVEVSEDVTYLGCRAGGLASSGTNYPHAPNASLGNTGSGFTVNASTRVLLDGCIGTHNINNGLDLINAASARIANSIFADNTEVGIYLDATSVPLCYVAPSVRMEDNAFDLSLPAPLNSINAIHLLPAPTVQNYSVGPVTNPFPFDVLVTLVGGGGGGWYWVQVDGATMGTTVPAVYHLKPGSTITLGYDGSAPTWVWQRL